MATLAKKYVYVLFSLLAFLDSTWAMMESEDDEDIYTQDIPRESSKFPTHIYSFGTVDDWGGWVRFKDYAKTSTPDRFL